MSPAHDRFLGRLTGAGRRLAGQARSRLFEPTLRYRVSTVGGRLAYHCGPGLWVDPRTWIEAIEEPGGARGATVTFDVGRDVRIGVGCTFEIWAQRDCHVRIGDGCHLDGARIVLRGGSVELGAGSTLRQGCALRVSGGALRIGAAVHLREGCMVHCMEAVTLRDRSTLAAHVTVSDLDHYHDGSDTWHLEREVETGPVTVGPNSFIGAGSAVLKGVVVGPNSVVGANSVVTRDLPPGHLSAGAPAAPIGPLERRPEVEAAARRPL